MPDVLVAIFAAALRSFSKEHRKRYGSEMICLFREQLERRAKEGLWQSLVFCVAASWNVLGAGLGERRARRRVTREHRDGLALGIGNDLYQATKSLTKSWMFSLVALFSISIGVGVCLALVLLLRVTVTPPFDLDQDGLVELVTEIPASRFGRWSFPDFVDIREATALDLAGWAGGEATIRPAEGEPGKRIFTAHVSPNYFEILRQGATIGRTLTQGDEGAAGEIPVVVSYNLWNETFGADPDIVGRSVLIAGAPHVIVGVAGRQFRHHTASNSKPSVWVPLDAHPFLRADSPKRHDRSLPWLSVFGRLRSGETLERANGLVGAGMTSLAEAYPTTNADRNGLVLPYAWQGNRVPDSTRWLIFSLFAAMCGTVLFVVSLNVAGMVSVRSASRERELALRLAVGSSRRRLVQYLMAEALVVALLGSILTASVLWATLRTLSWRLGVPIPTSLSVDVPILALCTALALGTTLVFGLLPALQFSRPQILNALKDDAGAGGRRSGVVHRIASALQTAVAVLVLIAAGGVTKGAMSLGQAELGVEQDNLFVWTPMDLSADGYGPTTTQGLARALQEEITALPGVVNVAISDGSPLDGVRRSRRVFSSEEGVRASARITRVGEGFFRTVGTPILRGRPIGEEDRLGMKPVAVVTESLAERLFPEQDPLGKSLTVVFRNGGAQTEDGEDGRREFTVVGISGNMGGAFLESSNDNVFLSLLQEQTATLALTIRAEGGTSDLSASVARITQNLDPELGRPDLATFEDLIDARSEFADWVVLLSVIAVLLLVLSAMGVYGVIAFSVVNRTREIGVRMSLGSSRGRILRMVVRDALTFAVPGLTLGVVAGVFLSRGVLNQMYVAIGLPLVNGTIYVLAAGGTLFVVLTACVYPALRAARVDPITALRAE